MCPEETHSSFCSLFFPAEFLTAATNLSSSTATSPNEVAYPMLKHLPRSGIIFNLSWSLHFFPSIWKTSIIPIHKMGKPLDSPASFRSISLITYVSKLFERIILSRPHFFLESNSILSPFQAGFRPGWSILDQILFLSRSISNGLTNPGRALGLFSLRLTSLKLPTLCGIRSFPRTYFGWPPSLLCSIVGLNLSFLTGVVAWFFKITKVVSFESVEVFRKNPFLAVYFSFFSLMIFLLLCSIPPGVLCMLTIWAVSRSLPGSLLRWRPHKKL